ncbi:MAG: heavy-metal-associated domain-containing protein [Gammaproteobacteria bacterium]|nr:heavy-metal-associated domain-containing protein [Gammaproteobacteria bacterium]
MSFEISVENIKCGGCANTISTKLNKMDVVDNCEINIEAGVITVSADPTYRSEIAQLLLKLGYPEKGSVEGLKAATTKAKSFVSCAVGKISA